MRSFWASIFGRPKTTEDLKSASHQNERAGLFPPVTIVEEVAEISKNGEEFYRDQGDELDERGNDSQSESRAEKYRSRLNSLLQGINKWQEVLSAELQARQKMREVGFKRSAVSQADASFMKEVQRLQAEGQLGAFKQLSKLADACQSARDGLGPLEYEGFEAQKKLQGHVWELQQVEDALFESFESELGESYEESSVTSGSSSAHDILEIPPPDIVKNHGIRNQQDEDTGDLFRPSTNIITDIERQQSHSEAPLSIKDPLKKRLVVHDLRMLLSHDETQPIPVVRFRHSVNTGSSVNGLSERPLALDQNNMERLKNPLLLGLENHGGLFLQEAHYDPTLSLDPENIEQVNYEGQQLEPTSGSDSGAFDLDMLEYKDMSTLTTKQHSSTESFPELLTQFGTKRDRINKWLLHKMLISRSEASLIGLQLQKEPDSSPSPWAKLIVAYFQFNYNTSKPASSQEVKNMSTEEKTSEHQQSSNYREEDTTITSHPTLQSKTTIEDTTAAPLANLHASANAKTCNNLPHQSICEGLAQVESSKHRPIKVGIRSLQVSNSERPIMMNREGMAT
ncbi:hypothetical protein BELL_0413g00010 [Botrytis elliptica]|uniref:Uncharacterized protein n=1 Tax=Botrytis elliptica TaxID=278938 RepID=A0A4Z1JMT5_9HELO|nr:hypothetical protein EAE99_009702 [Botrytis elliptica]TGO72840.1 hypothetical protein BELL_0413g00010 [Botrytis elliptica]